MHIPANNKKELGLKIKGQREKERLSLRKVASRCEISPAALSDIENGIIFPTEKTFLRIIDAINYVNKPEVCDLYGELKSTVPPDVASYLINNRQAVEGIRLLMTQEQREQDEPFE